MAKSLDPKFHAFLKEAEVRKGPFMDSGLGVETLKSMPRRKLRRKLKSLGVTDLECPRIEQQLDGRKPTYGDEQMSEEACRADLRRRDAQLRSRYAPRSHRIEPKAHLIASFGAHARFGKREAQVVAIFRGK